MSTEKTKTENRVNERVYEALFIFDSDQYGRNPEGVSGFVSREVESRGGEVLVHRLWEERRLAYPINGHRRGTYWLTYFKIGTDQLKDLNRQFQITDNILRFIFVRLEPKLVDALVEYAKTGTFHPVGDEAALEAIDAVVDDVIEV
ncbi:MAG: 30S ribosomal protein S6 [Thermoguttaceae bacterium]